MLILLPSVSAVLPPWGGMYQVLCGLVFVVDYFGCWCCEELWLVLFPASCWLYSGISCNMMVELILEESLVFYKIKMTTKEGEINFFLKMWTISVVLHVCMRDGSFQDVFFLARFGRRAQTNSLIN